MVACRYTLLDQSVTTRVLAACDQEGTRIVAAAVFTSDLLAGSLEKPGTFDYADALQRLLDRTKAIEAVRARYRVELTTALPANLCSDLAERGLVPQCG